MRSLIRNPETHVTLLLMSGKRDPLLIRGVADKGWCVFCGVFFVGGFFCVCVFVFFFPSFLSLYVMFLLVLELLSWLFNLFLFLL